MRGLNLNVPLKRRSRCVFVSLLCPPILNSNSYVSRRIRYLDLFSSFHLRFGTSPPSLPPSLPHSLPHSLPLPLSLPFSTHHIHSLVTNRAGAFKRRRTLRSVVSIATPGTRWTADAEFGMPSAAEVSAAHGHPV